MNLKIFVCHSTGYDRVMPASPYYIHMRGGSALDKEDIEGTMRDDSGDNISKKNKSYCELTVQYWAWKNIDADYYGFCHYRRYFSFNQPESQKPDIYANVSFDFFNDNVFSQILSDGDDIIKKMKGSPIALTTPFDVRSVNSSSVYNHYTEDVHLYAKDMDVLLDVIHAVSPEFDQITQEYINGHILYPCNMFIMNRELFFRYCNWLFQILAECEKRIDVSGYNMDELRVVGHLGERCLGIFYTYINRNENISAAFFQRLLIWQPEAGIEPRLKFEDQVTVATASSNFYIPYLAVMIQSFLENTTPGNNYGLYILHTDITRENQKKIQALSKNYPNVFISFYNMNMDIFSFPFKNSEWTRHISNETFYRTLIHKVFRCFDKVLYLDIDIIIKADIAGLYKLDIGDNLIGACLDGDFIGYYYANSDAKQYTETVLKLQYPVQYFQGGVLLVNICQFRKEFDDNFFANKAAGTNYRWADQDVFNVCCHGRVTFIEPDWNVMVQHRWDRIATIKKCPYNIYHQYINSRNAPKIIHYAGGQKPWFDPDMDFADEFWRVARTTPFYEVIIKRMAENSFMDSLAGINNSLQGERDQLRSERDALIASVSFRLGRKFTWFPRKVRGFFHCMKDHGVFHTLKHFFRKCMRCVLRKI